MMVLETLPAALVAFLLNYTLHSSVVIIATAMFVGLVASRVRPELRVLAWKLALTLPLLTATAISVADVPHWGWKFSMREAGEPTQPIAGEVRRNARTTLSSLKGHASSREPDTMPFPVRAQLDGIEMSAETPGWGELLQSIGRIRPNRKLLLVIIALWATGSFAGMLQLIATLRALHQMRRDAVAMKSAELTQAFAELKSLLNVVRPVALLESRVVVGPMTAGLMRPFILLPQNPVNATEEDDSGADEFRALLAHELAHVARHDAAWNLFIRLLLVAFPFQPLNHFAGRALRKEMDFVADAMAARILGDRSGLAKCLLRLGSRVAAPRAAAFCESTLVASMASFRSMLGRRLEALLASDNDLSPSPLMNRCLLTIVMSASVLIVAAVMPQASGQFSSASRTTSSDDSLRNSTMSRSAPVLALLFSLPTSVTADEPAKVALPSVQALEAASKLKTTPDELPEGVQRFNGMLVGRLAARDVEQGTFVVQVDAVSRVWENSKAEDPKSLVGKSVNVSGVFGKFLDVLVVTRVGETIEFECKHDGEKLVFPGELLRKVAPYDPEDYPVLPEGFRGFRGTVSAEVLKKDAESLEVIVKVNKVVESWKDSDAREPKSIEGHHMLVAGFWNRRDMFHKLKVGDRFETGLRHISRRSDHMTIAEYVRIAGESAEMKKDDVPTVADDRMPKAQRGFRGMLVGRLVEKDPERGTFTVTVDAVPRVWEKNQADNPKSLIGTNVAVEGVQGRMLDALVVSKVGETVEFGALHDGGSRIRVGEVLRKVSPVQPGDYPVLPDGFRGFKGMVTAKVIRRDAELLELVIELTEIRESFEGSRAKDPNSIVGQKAMLAGFWQRKDAFHDISEGDMIQCGISHPQLLSDHLTVIESVQKLETK
jgi:beta-lactamase regulating signal transducer with metallopeptidase domain